MIEGWRALTADLSPSQRQAFRVLPISGLMILTAFLFRTVYVLFGRWGVLGWSVAYFGLAVLAYIRVRAILTEAWGRLEELRSTHVEGSDSPSE